VDKLSRDEELRALVAEWRKTVVRGLDPSWAEDGYGIEHGIDMCANELAAILARHDAQGEAYIGKTVSVDMSTDDASAEHRIFGKVIGVQDDTLLCEFVEQNYPGKREAVVTDTVAVDRVTLTELLDHNIEAAEIATAAAGGSIDFIEQRGGREADDDMDRIAYHLFYSLFAAEKLRAALTAALAAKEAK
jgi:hypothetical protein